MYSKSLRATLEIRSYFFEGLYALMTSEERRYFWGKEVLSAIGADLLQKGADAYDQGNPAVPGYSSSMYLLKQDTKS